MWQAIFDEKLAGSNKTKLISAFVDEKSLIDDVVLSFFSPVPIVDKKATSFGKGKKYFLFTQKRPNFCFLDVNIWC